MIGSPSELYEERVGHPHVFTILRPSQRSWWAQFDNIGTLDGSLGSVTVPEVD